MDTAAVNRAGQRRSVVLAVVVGVLMLTSTLADAHTAGTYYKKKWVRDKSVTYSFTSSVPTGAWRDRTNNGAAQWNALGRSMTFTPSGTTVGNFNPYQCPSSYQTNAIHRRSIDGAGGSLAQTISCVYSGTAEMYSFQTVFDSSENWNTGTALPARNQPDLWSIASHELGHATGFGGHFSGSTYCSNNDAQQTLCQVHWMGTSRQRTLGEHDKHTFSGAY